MLEYVFFDQRPRDSFVEYVAGLGIQARQEHEEGIFKVLLSEDLADELSERIEDFYDQMMALNRQLYEQEGDAEDVGYHAAGITLQLRDGVNVYAQVDPNLLGRIMQVLSPDEFNQVVNAIVEAVESPDTRSLCQRMRDQQQGWD